MRTPTATEWAAWREASRATGQLDESGRIRPGAYDRVQVGPTAVFLRCMTYLPAIFFAAHDANTTPRRFDRDESGVILLPGTCWTALLRGHAKLEPAVVPASMAVPPADVRAVQALAVRALQVAVILDATLPADTDTIEVFLRDKEDGSTLIAYEALPPGTEIEVPYRLRARW